MDNDTKEILLILQEECTEVAKEVSKIMRFGADSVNPLTQKSNIESLIEELGDLLAMVDLLVNNHDSVNWSAIHLAKTAKIEKLKIWSNLRGLG